MKVWLCEKPSQGNDIAKALGLVQKGQGYIETRDGIVTWAIGHLFEEAPPHAYGEEFKSWSAATLPIIPSEWKILLKTKVASQFNVIKDVLKKATHVIIATDPDAEGERIARNILLQCNYRGPIQRLWSGSMLEESLRKAFTQLKEGSETEGFYESSLARSRGDWLVGMNYTRYFTLLAQSINPSTPGNQSPVLRIGRVKTPTLWMVVKREEEIENFKPKNYFELVGTLNQNGRDTTVKLLHAPREEDDRIYDPKKAQEMADSCLGVDAPLHIETSAKKTIPPKPFSLFDLQRYANSAWNWTADQTLTIAQSLYETHKATTYPRTDCGFLPEESIEEVPRILDFLTRMEEFPDADKIIRQKGGPVYRKSTFDSKKITAHHGIIPTLQKPNLANMSSDEVKAYLAIARRFIATVSPDYEYNRTVVTLEPQKDIVFGASGSVPTFLGWRAHYQGISDEDLSEEDEGGIFPEMDNGAPANLKPIEVVQKTTKPPNYYTESTLLADMKGVKKFVEDPELKKILNDEEGIGTEATRSNIIKELKEAYLYTFGKKYLRPTEIGTSLIHLVLSDTAQLCDPGQTALWEKETAKMREHGTSSSVLINKIAKEIEKAIGRGKEKNPGISAVGGSTPPKDTGRTTPEGRPIFDCGRYFDITGICKLYREVSGTVMTLEDAYAIAHKGETPVKSFFSPKSKKNFDAILVLEKGKLVFKFPEGGGGGGPLTSSGETAKGKDIMENEKMISIPGLLQVSKTILSAKITILDAKAIIEKGHAGPFTFTKTDGKTFTAFLVAKEGKASFEFDNGQFSEKSPTSTLCPLSNQPILESKTHFFTPTAPNIGIPKTFMSKELHPADVASILQSGKSGVEMELLSARTGNKFKAKVCFNPKAEKFPGLQLIFEERAGGASSGGGGKPPAKKAAKKVPKRS